MQSTAIHTRFFAVIYGTAKRSNIDGCVNIAIHIVSAVIAFKYLSFSIAYVVAVATSLACVSWINKNNLNAIKNSFVGNILTQLIERPLTNPCSKFFTFFKRRKADAFKVFKRNSFVFFFGNLNNLFGDCVVDNRSGCAFSTTKPFQEFFTSSCAFALNGASYFLSFFSIILNFFSVKFFTITKGCYAYKPKIHTQERFNIFYTFFRNINSLKQVKLTFLVNQIRFSFNVRKVVSVMTNKRYFNPTTNSPKRNNVIRLVGHNTAIIPNASDWTKFSFDFFVKFVSICNFCNAAYQNLTAKFKSSLVAMIYFVMEFKIIENTLFPSYIRNGIANSISFFYCIEKQFSLFVSRQKFYFQSEFHKIKILNNFTYQKIITNFIKQFKAWQSHSSQRAFGINRFPAPIL